MSCSTWRCALSQVVVSFHPVQTGWHPSRESYRRLDCRRSPIPEKSVNLCGYLDSLHFRCADAGDGISGLQSGVLFHVLSLLPNSCVTERISIFLWSLLGYCPSSVIDWFKWFYSTSLFTIPKPTCALKVCVCVCVLLVFVFFLMVRTFCVESTRSVITCLYQRDFLASVYIKYLLPCSHFFQCISFAFLWDPYNYKVFGQITVLYKTENCILPFP